MVRQSEHRKGKKRDEAPPESYSGFIPLLICITSAWSVTQYFKTATGMHRKKSDRVLRHFRISGNKLRGQGVKNIFFL